MDLGFCGLTDIILILLLILSLFIGFRKGFMNKVVSLVGIIGIFVFAIFFCKSFASFLISGILKNPYTNMRQKFYDTAISKIPDPSSATAAEALAAALSIPQWIASLICKAFSNIDTENVIDSMATVAATWVFNIISFVVIVVGCLIVLGILKAIIKGIRNIKLVSVVDGILGMLLYGAIYLVIVTALFALLHIFIENNMIDGMTKWVTTDFQLDTEKVRLSKTLYNQNFFITVWNYIKAMFGK